VAGFSKTYSMTGWRLGTLVAPAPIAKACAELQSQMSSNATTFAQYGALAALKEKEKAVAALAEMKSAFDRRRKHLYAELNKIPGIRAGNVEDHYSAHQGVEHDDMNVLVLGGRTIGLAVAEELVRAFLGARYTGEARHARRLGKVLEIEANPERFRAMADGHAGAASGVAAPRT
jgi:aspartate/methionine/tyrosine aminotransferase